VPSRVKIFFDGGCRPNPGAMEIAVVVGGRAHVVRDLGEGTSMDAEWLALIHALRTARALDLSDFVLMGDAAAVIDQATGVVKCRGSNATHLQAFRALFEGDGPPSIRYVKRSQNLAGIALAKLHPR
jgi:ribonuclease HI